MQDTAMGKVTIGIEMHEGGSALMRDVETSEFCREYWTNDAARSRVEQYRAMMLRGEWLGPVDYLNVNRGPMDYATTPIVFLDDGRLYEGKHRMAALATLPGLSLPMLVIRGWGGTLPIPCGWESGWRGQITDWWRFQQSTFNAANHFMQSPHNTIILEVSNGIVV